MSREVIDRSVALHSLLTQDTNILSWMEVDTELLDVSELLWTDVTVAGVGLARPVFPSVISL